MRSVKMLITNEWTEILKYIFQITGSSGGN